MAYTAGMTLLAAVAKDLPGPAMEKFVNAANEGESDGLGHNDCMRKAWEEVREDWRKPDTGKVWVRKDNPGAGDVHVDAPMNGKKPKKKPPEEIKDSDGVKKFASVCKVDDSLGLVFGWAIVCTKGGEPYFDTQDDNIPEDSMLKAAADFMQNSRVAKDMHQGDEIGPIVFAFPMTADIAKSLDIQTDTTGLLIAMKPPADILSKFKSQEYTGFSIGGTRLVDEEAE
jgi:hypothetical protein